MSARGDDAGALPSRRGPLEVGAGVSAPALAHGVPVTDTWSSYGRIAPAGGDTAATLNLQRRLQVIGRCNDVRGKRILDCGCGAGEYVRALQRMGAEAWGVEVSADKIAAAHPDVSRRLFLGDLHDIAVPAAAIDVALLNEVLEHVPDDRRALREVFRILKPGGTIVVFSPNRRYPFETHGAFVRGSGARLPHYVPLVPYLPLALSRRLLDFWARNYWPGELRTMVRGAGFLVRDLDYVWQTFEGISRNQPRLIGLLSPILRQIARLLEQLPLVRSLGASQVIIATKEPQAAR